MLRKTFQPRHRESQLYEKTYEKTYDDNPSYVPRHNFPKYSSIGDNYNIYKLSSSLKKTSLAPTPSSSYMAKTNNINARDSRSNTSPIQTSLPSKRQSSLANNRQSSLANNRQSSLANNRQSNLPNKSISGIKVQKDYNRVERPSVITNPKPKLTTKSLPRPVVTFDEKSCRICGRSFEFKERLEKHEKICSSTSLKTRTLFDSAEQRFKGKPDEYIESYKSSLNTTIKSPKTNWRAQHSYFIASVRAAKGESDSNCTTAQLTAALLQPCVYCKRKFNKQALARHLPICAKLYNKSILDVKNKSKIRK